MLKSAADGEELCPLTRPDGQRADRGRPIAARLLLLLSLSGHLACGSTPKPVTWQDSMQSWYNNGSVRPDQPPRSLWERPDEDLLQKRIGFADLVVVGTAHVVTLFSALDAPRQLALAFRPQEVIHGSLDGLVDQEGELLLTIDSSDEDFQMAVKTFEHLPGSRYLLVLKRKPSKDSKKPQVRWSLYKPDKTLLREIRAMYHWLEQKKKK